jgi:hypothetical protein
MSRDTPGDVTPVRPVNLRLIVAEGEAAERPDLEFLNDVIPGINVGR